VPQALRDMDNVVLLPPFGHVPREVRVVDMWMMAVENLKAARGANAPNRRLNGPRPRAHMTCGHEEI